MLLFQFAQSFCSQIMRGKSWLMNKMNKFMISLVWGQRFCPMCSGGFGTHFLPYQCAPLSVLLSLALRPLLLLFFHPISQSHPQQLPPLLTSLLTSPFVFSKAPPTTDGQPRWPIKQLLRMATVTGFTIWSVCWGVFNVPVHECMKCYNVWE